MTYYCSLDFLAPIYGPSFLAQSGSVNIRPFFLFRLHRNFGIVTAHFFMQIYRH